MSSNSVFIVLEMASGYRNQRLLKRHPARSERTYDRDYKVASFSVGDRTVKEISSEDIGSQTECARGETHDAPSEERVHTPSLPDRREVLRQGRKLAFVVPVVMTFSAKDAFAAGSNHSCYALGHACPGNEPCCGDLVCSGGQCTNETCVEAGGLCFADSDCCSGDCQLGACQ